MSPLHDLSELRTLLDSLCEETITDEQVRRLEELVLAHPEAEAYYVQYMSQHADLVSHFAALPVPAEQTLRARAAGGGDKETRSQGDKESRRVFSWIRLSLSPPLLVSLSTLAAGLLLALMLWPRPADGPVRRGPAPEAIDNTVAVLIQAAGAHWEQTGLPMRTGAALPPGWLRLQAGLAQIEFYNGARVLLEGPAELQLVSRTQAYCRRGKLRAVVPPQANGFTIGSPKLDLVDRGTEFGLEVGADGQTEVHVFQGKVELYDPAAGRKEPRHELTTGQGVRVDGPGEARPIPSNPAAFRTAQELATRSQAETKRRRAAWLAASQALRRDPSLLVYYPFEADPPGARTLLDQARDRREPHDGAIVGCTWVDGRWPGKPALEFKRVSDRVRLRVPGEFDSLTFIAWVRVDGLPNLNDSLFMADGWEPGAPHWQLRDDGTLILGVQNHLKKAGAHYHAREAITPAHLSQWTHLATVYDRAAGQVSHYVDGQQVSREFVQFDLPLKIGDAELGNWNMAAHRNPTPVRFFSGRMDEFALFARALTEAEVGRLYEQGRPPS
jgi:hypothetical protein